MRGEDSDSEKAIACEQVNIESRLLRLRVWKLENAMREMKEQIKRQTGS